MFIRKLKFYIGPILLIYLLICTIKVNYGQVIEDTGQIFIEISDIISSMPGHSGDDYSEPDLLVINSWGNMMDDIFAGNYSQAGITANLMGYDLVRFQDTSELVHTTYYILKSNESNYWGTYIYNPNYCRPLVIQVPHPKKEINTGKEGIHVFKKTKALFYCLSGTSRCNHSSYSSCDGTTTICSDSVENYRISDMAHNVNSIFQKTTEKLLNDFCNTYFIQLHGFTKKPTDPYVILSNGTQETPDLDYIPLLKNNLFDEDTSLTFKIAHIDLDWTRLRGFTITQGRLVNFSQEPCFAYATTTSGRFINIEQEKTKLRNDLAGWDKIANALINTFICYPFLWKGSSDTDWNNADNWREDTVPTPFDNVSIAHGTYDPVINNGVGLPVICNNLEIQDAATLIINPGKALTVNGAISNSGSFIIRSDADGTGSLLHLSANVQATVEQYLTDDKWHYISAPVNDPKAEVFLGMYMIKWDEPAGQWNEIINPDHVMSTDMEGFAIWTWDISTVTFSGILNTGEKSFNTTNTYEATHNNKGFNFCGNPYVSSLNWNVNDGNGWERTAGNTDPSLYIWNQDAGNYGVYLKDNSTGTHGVDSIIPSHQGFFVHCSSATGYINVDNGARLHASGDILKETGIVNGSILKLRVEGNSYADEILLLMNPLASANYDILYDALKFRGQEDAPQLYSFSDDNRLLSVNSLPLTEKYKIIPLGLEVGLDNIYTISADKLYGLDFIKNIYLEDLKTGIFTKIESSSSYSFIANTNEEPIRFRLHLNLETDGPDYLGNRINIYSLNKTIFINTPENTKGNIIIYTVMGQEVANATINETVTQISINRNAPYVVFVASNLEVVAKKVIINY